MHTYADHLAAMRRFHAGEPSADRRVVQCNYAVATKIAAQGARAYLVLPNPGGGHDRITILVRSRGGRWVEKWEDTRRLRDFRVKTLPPEHPLYGNDRLYPAEHAGDLLRLLGATVNEPTCVALGRPLSDDEVCDIAVASGWIEDTPEARAAYLSENE